jgi:ubiquinone/menaquinone biosynthesis C-methylase UbiE
MGHFAENGLGVAALWEGRLIGYLCSYLPREDALLIQLMRVLKQEGYRLLGVDCESFNPNARGFWSKYFEEYTHSVVRRIDDKAIEG